ncbi:phosphoenolpyruvate synthase, partial [Vibrio parahaemolyticus V-223/04]
RYSCYRWLWRRDEQTDRWRNRNRLLFRR